MKKILLFIILFGTTLISKSQTSIPGGNVYGTWTLANSPYLIQGSIFIPQDSLLTIHPGVIVNFQGSYKLLVLGRLIAIGTVTDTIIFTAANTTNGWRGIRFDNTLSTNDTSKIYYCKLQYGNANGASPDDKGGALYFSNFSKAIISKCGISNNAATNNGGGIYCYNSSIKISNNIISNNSAYYGGGISCYNSSPNISDNIFSYNTGADGGGISCQSSSNPTISNNTFSYNTINNLGGGIYCTSSNPDINNNTIYSNSALYGGGIFCSFSSPNISNNTISNNTSSNKGGGIYSQSNNSVISNNVISNNTASSGGGIYCSDSGTPTIINNTIANNSANNGGALYCDYSSNPTFRNTILYGNTASSNGAQVFLLDEPSDPNFYYCAVQGGTAAFGLNNNIYLGTYQNNINADPLFVSPSNGSGTGFNGVTADWSLQSISPCIDAGNPTGTYPATDKAGNPRVVGNNIDIGAYEYQGISGVANNDLQNQIIIYPNPFSSDLILKAIDSFKNSTLTIYYSSGQVVNQIKNISGQTITVHRDNLPSGLYFIRLIQDNQTIKTDKLIIID